MKILSNVVGMAAGAAFFGGTTVLAALLLSAQVPGVGDMLDTVRCAVGFPGPDSACVTDRLQAAEDAARDARAALHAAEAGQNLAFVQGAQITDDISLIVGTIYRDEAGVPNPSRSFCYANLDHGGLDPRVILAEQDADGDISVLPITANDLAMLKVDAAALESARATCNWPVQN